MAGRGQTERAARRGTSRSFYWLADSVSGELKIECTRGADHYMHKTETRGAGVLKGTTLWVCRDCEPQVDGKWLAQIEWEKERVQSQ